MNDTDHSTTHSSGAGSTDEGAAAQLAETGTASWKAAVRRQIRAIPDHADFYALAGEMVATLYHVDDLAQVLRRQVAGYVEHQQAQGRQVYDDTRQVEPAERLHDAVLALQELHSLVFSAADRANLFWSAIGHVGVQNAAADVTEPDITEPDDQSGATP